MLQWEGLLRTLLLRAVWLLCCSGVCAKEPPNPCELNCSTIVVSSCSSVQRVTVKTPHVAERENWPSSNAGLRGRPKAWVAAFHLISPLRGCNFFQLHNHNEWERDSGPASRRSSSQNWFSERPTGHHSVLLLVSAISSAKRGLCYWYLGIKNTLAGRTLCLILPTSGIARPMVFRSMVNVLSLPSGHYNCLQVFSCHSCSDQPISLSGFL